VRVRGGMKIASVEPMEQLTKLGDTVNANPERTARVLAKSIYRELREGGLQHQSVLAVATELIALLAADVRSKEAD